MVTENKARTWESWDLDENGFPIITEPISKGEKVRIGAHFFNKLVMSQQTETARYLVQIVYDEWYETIPTREHCDQIEPDKSALQNTCVVTHDSRTDSIGEELVCGSLPPGDKTW